MTKKSFDDYKFSIRTQVKFLGEWNDIIEIRFDLGKVRIGSTRMLLLYSQIEDIRQQTTEPITS